MSETLTKIIVDCSTGQETIVPLSAEEIAEVEERAAAAAIFETERLAAEEAAAAKKASVLAAIAEATGLSAEDISEALA